MEEDSSVACVSEAMGEELWRPGGNSGGRFVPLLPLRGSAVAPVHVYLPVRVARRLHLARRDPRRHTGISDPRDPRYLRPPVAPHGPLAVLNRQCDWQEALERLTDYYRSALAETLRRRLDAAMSRRERSAGTPRIVACQCVLAAMKGCCAIR